MSLSGQFSIATLETAMRNGRKLIAGGSQDAATVLACFEALADEVRHAIAQESRPDMRQRDVSLSDAEQGLYRKYFVYRADGTDKAGERHHGDELFVLNLTTCAHARAAARAYAASCRDTHPQLSAELAKKAGCLTDATPQPEPERTDTLMLIGKWLPHQVDAMRRAYAHVGPTKLFTADTPLSPLTGDVNEIRINPPIFNGDSYTQGARADLKGE